MTNRRQVLIYYPHELKLGSSAPPVEVPGETARPARLWTLYTERNPDNPPSLPFVPSHHVNAWMEDFVHDWNWREGDGNSLLRYYTRVDPGHVWLLLEFDA